MLRHPYENAEQQEQAKEWVEQKQRAQKRAFEEIAAWLAALLAFIAAFFSVATYFRQPTSHHG